jgi:hypothetical protein
MVEEEAIEVCQLLIANCQLILKEAKNRELKAGI